MDLLRVATLTRGTCDVSNIEYRGCDDVANVATRRLGPDAGRCEKGRLDSEGGSTLGAEQESRQVLCRRQQSPGSINEDVEDVRNDLLDELDGSVCGGGMRHCEDRRICGMTIAKSNGRHDMLRVRLLQTHPAD
jgi:hypothetical protein